MDLHTAMEARGKYTCLSIQVDMSRPLITIFKISSHSQPVVYEGVNRLCFAYGWLGHWREVCQFTIKSSTSIPKDSLEPNTADCGDRAPTSPEVQPEVSTENRGASEEESSGTTFGPWMVISWKRKEDRLHKKSNNNPLTENRHVCLHVDDKELLGDKIFEKKTNGLGATRKNEGKRKAQDESGSKSSSIERELNLKPTSGVQMGFEQDKCEKVGRFNCGVSKSQPTPTLSRARRTMDVLGLPSLIYPCRPS